MAEFKLPELGENITTGTVTKVLVNVGDKVEKDQPVIELETEKAVVEVPCDVAGTVQEIRVKEGDAVAVGQVLMVLIGEEAKAPKAAAPATAKSEKPAAAPREVAVPARVEKVAPEPEPARAREEKPEVVEEAETEEELAEAPEVRRTVLAAPSVRRLARELGVDLQQVKPRGPGARVSAEDVKAHAEAVKAHAEAGKEPAAPSRGEEKREQPRPEQPPAEGVERDRYGEFSREPMSGVRIKTAEHISKAWETIPHVTQFDSADITELERFRKEYGTRVEAAGGKLTMTVIVMKVVAEGLKKFKKFNSFADVENQQIVFKRYINVGVAVDTEHGLIVPVIRNADTKTLTQLALEVGAAAERARSRKVSIDDLQGGTFTITNLGGIGGLWFTPIIREPEVAILGVSRARMEPVWAEGEFKPRLMLPLSLSYDHRVIDGADAARFIRWLVEALEQPMRMALD